MGFSEDAIDILRGMGLRITGPRRAILGLLEKTQQPLSAPEVHKRLQVTLKQTTVDRISVYRNLITLERAGLVHRVPPKGDFLVCTHRQCRSDQCSSEHHLLTWCESCSKVEEVGIPDNMLEPLYRHIRKKYKFIAEEHLVQVSGTCQSCCTRNGK